MSWNECREYFKSCGRQEVIDEVGIEERLQFTKINWVRVFNGFLFEGENPAFPDPTVAEDYSVLFELIVEKIGKEKKEKFKNLSQVCSILDVFLGDKMTFYKNIDNIYGPAIGMRGRKIQAKKDAIIAARNMWYDEIFDNNKSAKPAIEIFARTEYHSALAQLIRDRYGFDVMIINGQDKDNKTSNAKCENQAKIFASTRPGKNVVFIADRMGNRSFSVPPIKMVLLLMDSCQQSTLTQDIGRALTENPNYDSCWIMDYRTAKNAAPDKLRYFLANEDKDETEKNVIETWRRDRESIDIWDCFSDLTNGDSAWKKMDDQAIAKMIANPRSSTALAEIGMDAIDIPSDFLDQIVLPKSKANDDGDEDTRYRGDGLIGRSVEKPGKGKGHSEKKKDDDQSKKTKEQKTKEFIVNFIKTCRFLVDVPGATFDIRWKKFVKDGCMKDVCAATHIDIKFFNAAEDAMYERFPAALDKILSDYCGEMKDWDFDSFIEDDEKGIDN